MAKLKPLSAAMAIALGDAIEHGNRLDRYVGGYWGWPGCSRDHNGHPVPSYNSSTVQALVDRGKMTYSEWKTGRERTFPIVAIVVQEAEENA